MKMGVNVARLYDAQSIGDTRTHETRAVILLACGIAGNNQPLHGGGKIPQAICTALKTFQPLPLEVLGFHLLPQRINVNRVSLFKIARSILQNVLSKIEIGRSQCPFVVVGIHNAPLLIAPRVAPGGAVVAISRIEIVNQWSLWWGVTMMVVGSLVSLLAKPELFKAAKEGLSGRTSVMSLVSSCPFYVTASSRLM